MMTMFRRKTEKEVVNLQDLKCPGRGEREWCNCDQTREKSDGDGKQERTQERTQERSFSEWQRPVRDWLQPVSDWQRPLVQWQLPLLDW